jgi:predicted nucleic acid-binding protein
VPAAFWDTSALIPICIYEQTSPAAAALALQFSQVVWWGTLAEMHSALARVVRSGTLDGLAAQRSLQILDELSRKWDEILPSHKLRDRACDLLHLHPLKAADSLQLAAALVWCQGRTTGRTFISGDSRLCEAAAQEGFAVTQIKP